MALVDLGKNAYRYIGGVEFGMTDGSRTVPIRVSDAALNGCEPKVRRGSDYLGIFERHRRDIVDAACRKSAYGQFEPDGTILVRTVDLNR
jgi:Protein of unknown function (DUF1488)